MGIDGSTELHLRQKLLHSRNEETSNCTEPKISPVGNTTAHLNGTSKLKI